ARRHFDHNTETDSRFRQILIGLINQEVGGNHRKIGNGYFHESIPLVGGDVDFLSADYGVGSWKTAKDPARDAKAVFDMISAGDYQQMLVLSGRTCQITDRRFGHGFV